MGMTLKTGTAWAAELHDPAGRPLGCVVEPAATPLVGRGAQTVLLVRTPPPGGVGHPSRQ